LINFIGKKHLFKDDLFIKSTNYEFWNRFENKYDVIKLDFSEISESGSFEEFQKKFGGMLLRAVHTRSIKLERDFPSEMFESLIKRLNPSRSRESRIVLLIDEYDAPLNNARGEEYFKAIHREPSIFLFHG